MMRLFHHGRRVTIVAVALGLSSCTQGPEYSAPGVAPQAGYGAVNGVAVEGGAVAAEWSTLFRSAALNSLVADALAHNPDLESARRGLAAAAHELAALGGTQAPQLSADGGLERGHINGSFLFAPVEEITATGYRWNIGPSLAYNLDVFGGVRRAVEAQGAEAAAARDQALNTSVSLVDQVVVTAFQWTAADRQIAVTETLVTDLQAQLDLTQSLERAGKITHADALQALSQVENIRATLPGLAHRREVYRHALARLTGKTPSEFIMPAMAIDDFTLPGDLPVSLASDLVRQRPDIRVAEDLLHAASARIGVAEAARLPSIVLSGQFAQQATRLNQLMTGPGSIWNFGVDVSGPLFDGGTRAARADEARDAYGQAAATYRSVVINAFVEVADALDALSRDGEGYAAHQRALVASGANRDLAVAQYRAGKVDQLQVLVAEQQFHTAALNEIDADIQRFTDVAELFRALGGGWWNGAPNSDKPGIDGPTAAEQRDVYAFGEHP